MTKRYLQVVAATLFAFSTNAQGIVSLTDEDGHNVNGTVIFSPCPSSTDTVSLFTTLSGGTARTVNVRRYEVWPVAGSFDFFCWGVCNLPVSSGTHPTWLSQDAVDMAPAISYNNFHAYYQPMGNTSTTSRFRFVWFDTANPNGPDSSWVDLDHCGFVGLEELNNTNGLSIWPSPSDGQDVQVSFNLDRNQVGTRVVLYNVLGEPVHQVAVQGRQGRVVLPTGVLVPGVYFANLERQGRMLTTRRLVITR
ncbi:MAG: T9SS type A sorting domain-containing protein [Flavobacteriales bacterium]|nr:T9SS type A sorting domain-containing protein [Flavobacteriales bacterium]MCC6937290.1 T9SS type A sorting domain-containing protein [Flavobacteriales bacterium]